MIGIIIFAVLAMLCWAFIHACDNEPEECYWYMESNGHAFSNACGGMVPPDESCSKCPFYVELGGNDETTETTDS
ncbi:MAG: hypothetical protein LUE29_09645 [Lachnospiraceae bacterium]|nr:hypothetical protein [Lachnospiraceae bacterium]